MNVGWLFGRDILLFLAGGLGVTLALAISSIAISFVLGVGLALARLSRLAVVRIPAIGYIEGMRALPVFLIILFAYLALPNVVCVGGSWVAPEAAIAEGNFHFIEEMAREAVALGLR